MITVANEVKALSTIPQDHMGLMIKLLKYKRLGNVLLSQHTVPEWAESLKNSSVSESGFVLKSTLLGSRISRSRQNLMRAFRENHKKVDF